MIIVTIDEHIENAISEEEAMSIVKVPESITKLQAMRVMKANGIWDAFNAFLISNSDAKDEWELSPVLVRSSTFIEIGKIYLSLSDVMLDQMFIAGSTL